MNKNYHTEKHKMYIRFLFLYLFLKQANSYPYFPKCNEIQIDTVLTSLNGKINGSCFNITVNYATKSETKPILTWFKVPFAEPPLNSLRFKSPVPIKNWNGTLDGTKISSYFL